MAIIFEKIIDIQSLHLFSAVKNVK